MRVPVIILFLIYGPGPFLVLGGGFLYLAFSAEWSFGGGWLSPLSFVIIPAYFTLIYSWFCLLFKGSQMKTWLIPFVPWAIVLFVLASILSPIIEILNNTADGSVVNEAENVVREIVNSLISTSIGLIFTVPVFLGSAIGWSRARVRLTKG